MTIQPAILALVFNHLVLPPQLPGKNDDSAEDVERDLTRRMTDAVKILRENSDSDTAAVWQSIEESLQALQSITNDSHINKVSLLSCLRGLQPDHAIILHIALQNAGLLIRQPHDETDTILFEAFEISPATEQTLAAQGALQWDFPDITVSLPRTEFDHPVFQENLAAFLEKTSTEPLDEFAAKSRKAGVEVPESRDTVDPAIITHFLMTIFETIGDRVDTPLLRKRIKDDVCWRNSEKPWRRSPFWLLLRVCVQRLLYLRLGDERGRMHYKTLMCVVFARLLMDSVDFLNPERCHLLRSKLCRRLAKLETEKDNSTSVMWRTKYTSLLRALRPLYQKAIEVTTTSIQTKWDFFKATTQRRVPHLPRRANEQDLRLTLPNSSEYFYTILDQPNRPSSMVPVVDSASLTQRYNSQQYSLLTSRFSSLAALELAIETQVHKLPKDKEESMKQCMYLAKQINDYLNVVGDAYVGNPEQMSVFILGIFELWVNMDRCATVVYPLLCNYHPGFNPELLDVTLFSRTRDMERLQEIQSYLHERCTRANSSTGCFADRYFDQGKAKNLHQVQQRIEEASQKSRTTKEAELQRINAEFLNITEKWSTSSCTHKRHPDGTHDIRGCRHCYYFRSRRRMKIQVHEDFLPRATNQAEKRAIVFELNIPQSFASYRTTTWNILNSFCGQTDTSTAEKPELLLSDYPQLRGYNRHPDPKGFSLASSTKSYLATHYNWKNLPTSKEYVLLPLGLTFSYYDARRQIWAKNVPRQLTFAHHFALRLPVHHPFTRLYSSPYFAADHAGPSSYDVIASASDIPPEVTVHEFMAHQNLRAGKSRRWMGIITELGSSNVNFSLPATTVLFQQLALQAGPRLDQEPDVLRVVHVIFRDQTFCRRLTEQINQHVDTISTNWRESNYMETLLTLATQLCALGCPESLVDSHRLLQKIRHVTITWTTLLRNEMRNAQEVDIADRMARFCFLSALLCRRTFSPQAICNAGIDAESFRVFVEATLSMQESLVVDVSKFTSTIQNMLVRDIKMTARMSPILRLLMKTYPRSLEVAIDTVWPEADNTPRVYSHWEILPAPYEGLVKSTVQAAENTMPQVFHYHLLEGHLWINGQPLGKLPDEIRNSEVLKELFGNQRLFARPSNLPGMSYVLGMYIKGHQIHIGYRKDQLVIKARGLGRILEFVPRHVFGNGSNFDLPGSLVFDCVHWIDLQSGILEVRRKPHIWTERQGNWSISIRYCRATRRGTSTLVDPNSKIFNQIAQIFCNFEQPHMLTVFQPVKGNLSVELKRMDLTFYVNNRGLLQCRQLGVEVDPNQDAGTLYGLQSMLVMRSVPNRSQRRVITTLGQVHYRRQGMHVTIRVENDGSYGNYLIDDVLGRLHSPPEPRLITHKAQLHALTSSFIPDPLTGRTGTEEALCCMQSGYFQPWVPMNAARLEMLRMLSHLTPRREYYPKDKKHQQIVHWDPELTVTIQHDAYQPIVDSIISMSERLSLFHSDTIGSPPETTSTIPHLRERSQWRRSIYERSGILSVEPSPPLDMLYASRGASCKSKSKRITNVREVVDLLWRQPNVVHTTSNLAMSFQGRPIIGGYTHTFTPYLLNECLSTDIAVEWGGLVNMCKNCDPGNVYNLIFHLGILAFANDANMTIVRSVVAFFLLDDLKKLEYPLYTSFTSFQIDQPPASDILSSLVKPLFSSHQEDSNKRKMDKNRKSFHQTSMDKREYRQKCEEESNDFVNFLIGQWPCAKPSASGFDAKYIDLSKPLQAVIPEWQRLYRNIQFWNHLKEVQAILDRYTTKKNVSFSHFSSNKKIFGPARYNHANPQLDQLLQKPGPFLRDKSFKEFSTASLVTVPPKHKSQSKAEVAEIETIVKRFTTSDCSTRSKYGQDLQKSIDALKTVNQMEEKSIRTDVDSRTQNVKFNNDISRARTVVHQYYQEICDCLSNDDSRFFWLNQSNIWPCVTPISILQQLRSISHCDFGIKMKKALITYGLAIVKLQRLIRMSEAFAKADERKLQQEYNNPGHSNWDPFENPDWLLLELETNIQIREDQINVALEMISPSSGANSVLQMNMGQGKTSVIMPLVACALAKGDILPRLLVPNALLSQTAQTLQSRLGGLLGREILHIPFSRRTPTTPHHLNEYRRLHEDMLNRSGIILGVPEHVLSFKLSGLQRVSDSKIPESVGLVTIQNWLDSVARDILDECDFTLAVKTQLIYPSGSQLAVDGHPNRWEATMMVLGLVAGHLPDLEREFPQSIDVMERVSTGFPVAYFLRQDVEEALIHRIMDDVCCGRTSILPTWDSPLNEQDSIRTFISQDIIDYSVTEKVATLFPDAPQMRKIIYLLRGLLVHGILLLCLKKRWNVQYGLHPLREPMAVPFHGKGVPSEQAEWGHPDVAILFTCLAFYHQGLDRKQLCQILQVVLHSDDPATEYNRWTQASHTLPEPLRHWNIINVDDDAQMEELWRHLRLSVTIINHFLSRFVFPVHAKQFNIKLQASGWDVPFHTDSKVLLSGDGVSRPRITTGFSGTNDNRRLLPLTIEQQDLPGLLHTNAEVLTYLLQKRNRDYKVTVDPRGKRLSEVELIKQLTGSEIRVLLDAGAFILEMDNQTLVRTWLQEDPGAQAAVYFGSDNTAWVRYRNGKTAPLLATPYAENMEECLVYLDEAHTRGTDLKLPPSARGALTLGLKQTKDHTVQAAMRLRQLGTTQSVTFFASPEVHQNILDVCEKDLRDVIDSADVVTWLLEQTCVTNTEVQHLYFAQGTDFCRRTQAAEHYNMFLTNDEHQKAYMGVLRQAEQQTLEQLYQPRIVQDISDTSTDPSSSSSDTTSLPFSGKVAMFMQELKERRKNVTQGSSSSTLALEEVEQEREVAFEIEEEREVQRPRVMEALEFPGLHFSILDFVRTGCLVGRSGFMRASQAIQSTQLAHKYRIDASFLLSRLYVSAEYTRTVKLRHKERNDNFMRPVTWVLWHARSKTAIVIIPEEAEVLIPIIRNTSSSVVHLILYAAPVTKKMLRFNHLDYYAIPSFPEGWTPPSWLPFELGILSGRLYFEISEYNTLLKRLDLNDTTPTRHTQEYVKRHLGFLYEWLSVRRQGQDISHTPMGYVCQGLQLRGDHPFFSDGAKTDDDSQLLRPGGYVAGTHDREEDYDSDEDVEEPEMADLCEQEDEKEDEDDLL